MKKFFLRLLHLRMKFTFVMKSGKEIVVYGRKLNITYRGDELTSYTLEGGTGKLFYVRLDEIAAILQ